MIASLLQAAVLLLIGAAIALIGCALVWMIVDIRDRDHDL